MPEDASAELSRQSYWDQRYDSANRTDGEVETFDWLRDFEKVKAFLLKHLPDAKSEPSILHSGNGNSLLPASLQTQLSYHNQSAIDFSPTVTSQMSAAYPTIRWCTMDIRQMTFPDSSFDIVIDKATLDAMLYGSLWDPSDEVRENVGRYVDEIARVLKPGGTLLYITWRQPHFIRPLLQRPGIWGLSVETLAEQPGGGGMFEYFGWVVKKL